MVPRNDITSTRKAEEEGQTDSGKERERRSAPSHLAGNTAGPGAVAANAIGLHERHIGAQLPRVF